MKELEQLQHTYLKQIEEATSLEVLDAIRVSALGKQGEISNLLKTLKDLEPNLRRDRGAALNQLKVYLTQSLETKKSILEKAQINEKIKTERVDVTLPVRPRKVGKLHPFTQGYFEAINIFRDMGFKVKEGSDIEDDYFNFTALNFPPEHPARQAQDTFYFKAKGDGVKKLLRTHTSPVQIHTMKGAKPPFQVIAPGRTYRCDSDPTHTPTFHQIEAFMVSESIHMGHLKSCLLEFIERFFDDKDMKVRIRPSYFPFTEPSAEVDIGLGGKWLEILGCGMIHPNVLRNCDIDPDKFQGFALGMGIERIVMLKYGLTDLRAFYDSDHRWLDYYGLSQWEAL